MYRYTYLINLFATSIQNGEQNEKYFKSDARFDNLYPFSIQVLAGKHWTPVTIACEVASFLSTQNNARVLDIGSGVGKFCLVAAHKNPNVFYYGVEQRKNLVDHAEAAREKLNIKNACFIHGNFTQLDFSKYDHFYFFNSFFENITINDKIDINVEFSQELLNYYNSFLSKQLEKKPAGTRLATLDSNDIAVPPGYKLVSTKMDNLLKFWIKT
jgi:SAM-dependent methyltransferase